MPYTITFTNNRTGKVMTRETEAYMPAYRILCDWAYQVGYEVHSIHAENMVVAGSPQAEFFIILEQTKQSTTCKQK